MSKQSMKTDFENRLKELVATWATKVLTQDGQWTVKGFVDVFRNVYTISADTKIVSKILEIHLFPRLLDFADRSGFKIVLADHQNYYPDFSFVSKRDERVRFAVDLKTTYRRPARPDHCNGFTLGSHGKYFVDRTSSKNIQFPYGSYDGHYCLGVIYTRAGRRTLQETETFSVDSLEAIPSVITDFEFFVAEKWRIASDRGGSGNTANIGSITYIPDIVTGNGMFAQLGEAVFDDYWVNYRKITVTDPGSGRASRISNLPDFLSYRQMDTSLIVAKYKRQRVEPKAEEDEDE